MIPDHLKPLERLELLMLLVRSISHLYDLGLSTYCPTCECFGLWSVSHASYGHSTYGHLRISVGSLSINIQKNDFSRSAIIVHERGWTCDPLGVVAESVLDFGFPIHVLLARGITVALDSWLKRYNCLAQLTNYHSRWHTIQERIDRAHTSYSLSWSSNY